MLSFRCFAFLFCWVVVIAYAPAGVDLIHTNAGCFNEKFKYPDSVMSVLFWPFANVEEASSNILSGTSFTAEAATVLYNRGCNFGENDCRPTKVSLHTKISDTQYLLDAYYGIGINALSSRTGPDPQKYIFVRWTGPMRGLLLPYLRGSLTINGADQHIALEFGDNMLDTSRFEITKAEILSLPENQRPSLWTPNDNFYGMVVDLPCLEGAIASNAYSKVIVDKCFQYLDSEWEVPDETNDVQWTTQKCARIPTLWQTLKSAGGLLEDVQSIKDVFK